jgi:hypothetical protein
VLRFDAARHAEEAMTELGDFPGQADDRQVEAPEAIVRSCDPCGNRVQHPRDGGSMSHSAGRSLVRRAGLAGLCLTMMVLAAGCSGGTPSSSSSQAPASSRTSAASRLTYVALGDSWPEGAHCGGCRTFAGLYADGLHARTGRHIDFHDLTGQAQPYFETAGGGSASLLKALRSDAATRDIVATADIILIATGPNEIGVAYEPSKAGTCGGADHMNCFRKLGSMWRRNFDAIASEIELLRDGKPTAIRLVDAANSFLSDPSLMQGLPKSYAMTEGALIFKILNDALCHAAALHHAVCVDVRPILNGPHLNRSVDENSAASMRAVADALLATGLPELPVARG